jgi:hypothetical protein
MQITVAIPTIPPRVDRLARAVASVGRQSFPAHAISIACDIDRDGAAITRDRALAAVATEWVAFLDDDDLLYADHLAVLAAHAQLTGADLVYPWFTVEDGGTDPFPEFFGRPWDPHHPHQVPVTFLARTDVVRAVGGFSAPFNPDTDHDPGAEGGHRAGEDLRLILRVNRSFKIAHVAERTWGWSHWLNDDGTVGNTSGIPSRW